MAKEFVLDNSIFISWCFENEGDDHEDEFLDSTSHAVALVACHLPD